jgi:hypothetical protein
MPSRADIPLHLQTPTNKTAFLEWLIDHPIDWATARALIHIWVKTTSTKLTTIEWLEMEESFRRPTSA